MQKPIKVNASVMVVSVAWLSVSAKKDLDVVLPSRANGGIHLGKSCSPLLHC